MLCILSYQYLRKSLPYVISLRKKLMFKQLQTNFLQTLHNGRHHLTLSFDTTLNDLNFHSRSHLYDNQQLPCSFSHKFLIDLDEI